MIRLPEKPRLVLRVGVAGTAMIDADCEASLKERLKEMYAVIVACLAELAPGVPPFSATPTSARYYCGKQPAHGEAPKPEDYPAFRLVTGLDRKSEQVAFVTLREFAEHVHKYHLDGEFTAYEFLGLLPFKIDAIRRCRPVQSPQEFDQLLGQCNWVIELDQNCEPSATSDLLGQVRQRRAERLHGKVLLRQCDLLIAVCDQSEVQTAGATRETIYSAIALGIPVVCLSIDETAHPKGSATDVSGTTPTIDAANDPCEAEISVKLLTNQHELDTWQGLTEDGWRDRLSSLLFHTLSDPSFLRSNLVKPVNETQSELPSEDEKFLSDFFHHGKMDHSFGRVCLWRRFRRITERRQKVNAPGASQGSAPSPKIAAYQAAAGALSGYYANLYRGAFLANAILAPAAVALALLGLLMGIIGPEHMFMLEGIGFGKLVILVLLLINTLQCNTRDWNRKAIDYRYLAERLRAMDFLPLLANLRPPLPRSTQYAKTVVRQSVVDWLFTAVTREIAPHVGLKPERNSDDADPASPAPHVCHPAIAEAGRRIQLDWLVGQIHYHRRNASIQHGIGHWIEHFIKVANISVIVVVIFDLVVLAAKSRLPDRKPQFEALSGVLLLFAALIPAMVASMNGFNFQAETERIGERSELTADILQHQLDEWQRLQSRLDGACNDPEDTGSWLLEALNLAEATAQTTVDEVAEWSVLYSRRLAEA